MSYVHFLDVFDPVGLPKGLSDRDAAEQARSQRLTTPQPAPAGAINAHPPTTTGHHRQRGRWPGPVARGVGSRRSAAGDG